MSHLDYYVRYGISPVRYDLTNVNAHLERRESLYRGLGLTPLSLRGADILEVAAGSGQNSLYLAVEDPSSLTLLEPNPTGIQDIQKLYAAQTIPHTAPTLLTTKLEDYAPADHFDIVICENWLGSSGHERGLLKKLGTFVESRGILVVTVVSPIGFLPNLIRRALAAKVASPHLGFENRTEILVDAFGPHLGTIASMTRTPVDWVHDNVMNPAYFGLCLTVPMVLNELGDQFSVLGSSPSFAQDWRWFKALHGQNRRFNEHFLSQYWQNCHNLIDYRNEWSGPSIEQNKQLEHESLGFIGGVREYEEGLVRSDAAGAADLCGRIERIAKAADGFPRSIIDGINEAAELLARDRIDAADVGGMRQFGSLFGRETLYLSLQKERP